MIFILCITVASAAVLISLSDKLIEYFAPRGGYAKISQDIEEVLNSLE